MGATKKGRDTADANCCDEASFDWGDFLAALQGNDDNGQTAKEIAAQVGRPPQWVRERIALAEAAGHVTSGSARRKFIDGTFRSKPVYRLTPEGRKMLKG